MFVVVRPDLLCCDQVCRVAVVDSVVVVVVVVLVVIVVVNSKCRYLV